MTEFDGRLRIAALLLSLPRDRVFAVQHRPLPFLFFYIFFLITSYGTGTIVVEERYRIAMTLEGNARKPAQIR